MRNVALRAAAQVELPYASNEPSHRGWQLNPIRSSRFGLIEQKRKQVGDRSLLDQQLSVHVELAEGELRIEHEAGAARSVRKRILSGTSEPSPQ